MSDSLAEALPKEIERCRESLQEYKNIGPIPELARTMVNRIIEKAVDAQVEGDVVQMIVSYKKLLNCC